MHIGLRFSKPYHRMLVTAVALLVTFTTTVAAADPRDDAVVQHLRAMDGKYRCPIFAYLVALRRIPPKQHDRYLIVSAQRRPEVYVQCGFFDEKDRNAVYCESASGWYRYADHSHRLVTDSQNKHLAALGFSTDADAGNYVLERRVRKLADLYDLAGVFVEAFAQIYDIGVDDDLVFDAPLVKRPPRADKIAHGRFCPDLVS